MYQAETCYRPRFSHSKFQKVLEVFPPVISRYADAITNGADRSQISGGLAGICAIFTGIRDDRGLLLGVNCVDTLSLHRTAVDWVKEKEKEGKESEDVRNQSQLCWEPFVSIKFIKFLFEKMRKACSASVGNAVRFAYRPSTGDLIG